MSPSAQTWTVAGATLLGVMVGFLGTAYLQHRQAKRDARIRLEGALAELVAAAQDLHVGVAAIRDAHQRRTRYSFYLRVAAMVIRDYPAPHNWRDLADLSRVRPLLATALEADRYQRDEARTITLDLATLVATKVNRFFVAGTLLRFRPDKEIIAAARELTSKVSALIGGSASRRHQFDHLADELLKAIDDFRAVADKRLGNLAPPRFWRRWPRSGLDTEHPHPEE